MSNLEVVLKAGEIAKVTVLRIPDEVITSAVLFYDFHGNEIGSLFADRAGQYGYLGNQSVSFHAGDLIPKLRKILATVL